MSLNLIQELLAKSVKKLQKQQADKDNRANGANADKRKLNDGEKSKYGQC